MFSCLYKPRSLCTNFSGFPHSAQKSLGTSEVGEISPYQLCSIPYTSENGEFFQLFGNSEYAYLVTKKNMIKHVNFELHDPLVELALPGMLLDERGIPCWL